jgi:hypothetical protein
MRHPSICVVSFAKELPKKKASSKTQIKKLINDYIQIPMKRPRSTKTAATTKKAQVYP